MKITYQVQIRDEAGDWKTIHSNITSSMEAEKLAWAFVRTDDYHGKGIQIIAEKPKQEYDFRSDKELMHMLDNRCTL